MSELCGILHLITLGESLDLKWMLVCVRLSNIHLPITVGHIYLALINVPVFFGLPQPSGLLSGLCATAGRSTLTTVLQVHELRRVSPIRVSNNSFLAILPFYISDLHWEEAFFSCISSSPPREVAHLEAFDRTTFRPRVITLTPTISCLRTSSAACNNRNWPSTYFDIGN
jgi:hypothetical protein